MAINIKSPVEGNKGKDPKAKSGGGVFNGEEGYQKRTPSPNAVPERTYEGDMPKGNLSIKSPAKSPKG